MSLTSLAIFTAIVLVQRGQGISLGIIPDGLDDILATVDPEPSDANLNFMQLAAKYGHPAEKYIVYTEDGYRLAVFRLPGPGNGLPVLLFHGVFDSSDTWIIRGKSSLAITLANAGYDVWLGNIRGNKYSQGHLSLSIDSNSTYWNFTFNEHGIYDLPTTIDLVLSETGAPKLNAIGHSQGTTMYFVLLSSKPDYNDKVNMLIALAPVAYLQHSPPPLSTFLSAGTTIYEELTAIDKYEVLGNGSPEYAVVKSTCSTEATAYSVCLNGVVYKFTGADVSQVDPSFSLVIFKHIPSATSSKNLLHFSQVATRKSFARFDYGKKLNLVAYNSATPPQYELSKVTSKMVLLTARNDYLSVQEDVILLARQLPNVVRYVVNPRSEMNHLDYVWGKNMSVYLFPYIFESLESYGQL